MDLDKIKQPENFPNEIKAFVEIPQGSSIKYEFDKETGFLTVDRFIYSTMFYPFNYGFIPNTKAKDGDPVDIMVMSSFPIQPGVMINVRPIGVLEMEDEAGIDDKIIVVPTKKVDPFYAHIESIDDIDEQTKEQIKYFFERYKDLEKGKWVKVRGFFDGGKALEIIKESV